MVGHTHIKYHHHHHHHHHVVPLARISLTLSRHLFLSFIAFGRSSGLHPESSHSCCMFVRAGHPAFAWPYAGVHRSTSLMSSSLLLQKCPACLARLLHLTHEEGGIKNIKIVIIDKNGHLLPITKTIQVRRARH